MGRSLWFECIPEAPSRVLWHLFPRAVLWFIAFGIGRWGVCFTSRAYLVPTTRLGKRLLLRAPHEAWRWLRQPATLWTAWATTLPSSNVTDAYQLYLGLYTHELPCVAAYDAPFRERPLYLLHHELTLLLLGASWCLSFERCGAAIMVVHDISDVLLCAAKCCKQNGSHAVAEVLFRAFAVSLFALRLGVLPTILASVVRDAPSALYANLSSWYARAQPIGLLFIPLLGTLQLMHVWWGWRIASVAYRHIVHGVLTDDEDG